MITILSLLMLLIIALLLKLKIVSDIFNPGILFSIFWVFQLLVISIMIDYTYTDGYYLLLLFSIVSIISAVIGEKTPIIITKKKSEFRLFFNIKLNRKILIIAIFFGCLFEIFKLKSNGMSILSIFDMQSLLDLNKENALNRYYGGGTSEGKLSKLLLVFVYFSPVIGGIHFNFSQKKVDKILSILSFLPAFLSMTAENTKSGVIASFFLFTSSFIISFIITQKNLKIRLRYIITLAIVFISTMYIFILSMVLRTGQLTKEIFVVAQNKIFIYALGHVPAFSYWITNENYQINGTGEYTFLGIYNFLGLANREQGVYKEAVLVNGIPTNIYTVFRGLITDFSVLGAYFFVFIFVLIATISYKNFKKNKGIYINSFILLNFYFFSFHSFLSSSWTYTSYIMVMFLFVPYIFTVVKKGEI